MKILFEFELLSSANLILLVSLVHNSLSKVEKKMHLILIFINFFVSCNLIYSALKINNTKQRCQHFFSTIDCNAPQINDPGQPGQCCDPNYNDPTKCACNVPQIDDPMNIGECCDPNGNNPNKCACTAPQIDDPINTGECCDPNDNDPTKCACISPQIDDPVNTGQCCHDSGDGVTCAGILKQCLNIQ